MNGALMNTWSWIAMRSSFESAVNAALPVPPGAVQSAVTLDSAGHSGG